MKVVHILSGLYQGGAESQLEKMISFSKSKDVEHIVISLKSNETPLMKRFREDGINVYCLGFSGFNVFFGFLKLINLLKYFDSPNTVIQCWMYHANLFGSMASVFSGVSGKIVWNIRRTELPTGVTGILSKLSAKWSYIQDVRIVCCAEAAKISHIDAGYNERNMKVFHNGIDVDLFIPSNSRKYAFRKNIKVNNDDFLIGMVGRYSPIKGHLYLLDAFLKLKVNNPDAAESVKLVLIGRDVDSAIELQPFFTNPLLERSLIVIPEQVDIWSAMSSFDLLCLPSRSEGFPNVVAEAMSSGVPVYATDVGDAAYILGNRSMIIPRENNVAVADKLFDFISLPDAVRLALGIAARERIIEHFSVEKSWDRYLNLYNQIIEKQN
ncbi:hypothetical protein CWN94_21320 [Vibrio splendidus]|uniref:glycosyltransferase n=1 Tax=Vibrio splendidus TaxID=29497 RepID=UPI000D39D43C|nr:glycosyltransferase [Vibrio splendidus]PTO51485.1 hypothetical protein CWN94_21320 [Vibrio splendidus]